MKLALLVIDMQKCFLSKYADRSSITECCEYINYTAGLLRSAGQMVIHVQDVEDAGEVSEADLDFIDEIEIESSDLRVKKVHSNAFWETDLEEIVQKNKIELLIVSGQAAEHCVVFTYNGARERGHKAVILQNGVVSQKADRVPALFQDRPVISYSVVEMLSS